MAAASDGAEDTAQAVSIEFLMHSGETFTVQHFLDGDVTDDAIRRLGEELVRDLESNRVRQFPYWEGDSYFFDAVRMNQVSAFSITLADAEEIDEDEEI